MLQYLPNGDLKNFLTVNNLIPLTLVNFMMISLIIIQENSRRIQTLMKYMNDIAMGMLYLSEKGLIHRVRDYLTCKF